MSSPLPAKAELRWIWATSREGDGGWLIDLNLTFALTFLRDNAPTSCPALVALQAVSALSIISAIVRRVEHLTSAFATERVPGFTSTGRSRSRA